MTTNMTARRYRVPVRFQGGRSAEGPLTYGQLNILQWLRASGNETGPAHATFEHAFTVPDDVPVTVADVTRVLAALLDRYESLRTVYIEGDQPRQRVIASGELKLEVYECDPDDPRDIPELIDDAVGPLRAEPYDPATQLPLRVAAVTQGGRVRTVLAGYSHLAVDRQAIEILGQEFARLIRGEAALGPAPRLHQPLDQARDEARPSARRRAEATLRYFEEHLRRMPQCPYPAPRAAVAGAAGASLAVELRSPAAALALPHVAARTRTNRSNVVLAAVCALITQRTGEVRWPFTVLIGNRFGSHLASYVGTLVQSGLQVADTDADSFDDLVRRTWAAGLRAARHGMYDVDRRVELVQRIERERGVTFCFEPLFNNAVPDRRLPTVLPPIDRVMDAVPRTHLHTRTMPPTPAAVRFDLWQTDETFRLEVWTGDSSRVTESEMRSMLRAVERLIVAAAAGDLDRERMRDLIGMPPIARGEGWLRVDGCWIELAETQRLVDDALAPYPARVFPAAEGRPLAAFVALTPGSASASGAPPASAVQAHDRCMAALAGRPTAMAPRYYVLCERAPADPADPAAWRRAGVIAEGSGR